MPTCGKFQLGPEIAYSDDAALYSATGPSAKTGVVVKVWRVFDDESAAAVIKGVEAQRLAAEAGCSGILPVFERGLDDTGSPFCATPACALSVRKMIEAQNRISSHHLERVVVGTLEALAEMALKCERPHGNLSPGNILLSHANPSQKGFRIYLGDMAPKERAGTFRDDVYTVGRIIYQMVRRTDRVPSHLNPPLEMSTEWDYLGKEAAGWLLVCNRLLGAKSDIGSGVLADALMALKDLGETDGSTGGPEPLAWKGLLVKAGIFGVLAGVLAGWYMREHRVVTKAPAKIAKAAFAELMQVESNDPVLAGFLQNASRETDADGGVPDVALNGATNDWVGKELGPMARLMDSGALDKWRLDLAENVTVDDTPKRDLKSLPSRLDSVRNVFKHNDEVLAKRTEVANLEGEILRRPDTNYFSFLGSWVNGQTAPGSSFDQVDKRLERTRSDLVRMRDFLTDKWPEVRQREFLAAAQQSAATFAGEKAVQNWLGMAEHYLPAPVVVAPVAPVEQPKPPEPPKELVAKTDDSVPPVPAKVEMKPQPPVEVAILTPSTPVTPLPPDPKEAAKARFRAYLQALLESMQGTAYTLQKAHQARDEFEKLRTTELQGLGEDAGVTGMQAAFKALPEGVAPVSFTLPQLEAKNWKLEKSGVDYAVYWRPDFTPAIKIPFHRVVGADGVPFAVSATEIPLLYAANSGAWAATKPPPGPQVWQIKGGRAVPADSWTWPAVKTVQDYLDKQQELTGDKKLYHNDSPPRPDWRTPVTGITGQEAAAIAAALGGSLPNVEQYRTMGKVAGKDAGAHLAGSALNAQMSGIEGIADRLYKSGAWSQPFFERLNGGDEVWPDTGSFAPAARHPAPPAPGGGGEGLWFLPVDRGSAAAPEKIYDFYGNVAEFVDGGAQGLYIAGGSALSASSASARYIPPKTYSDVGIRLVVAEVKSGGDDALLAFKTKVMSVASEPATAP